MNPITSSTTKSTTQVRREVAAYIALAYALCIAVVVALPHANINMMLAVLVPTVTVAILTFTITPRGGRRALWGSFGLNRAAVRTWPSALLIPMVLCAAAYATAVAVGAGRLQVDASDGDLTWWTNLPISLAMGTVFILGEEIGWRGYLLPRMQQLLPDRRRAALATGFVHGCFHLPLILIGTTYDNEVPGWVAAPAAVALITAGGVFYAWIWDRSRSVWPVAIAHNTVNTVFDLGAAAVVATGGANIAYVAGETGVATLAVVVVTAVVLWRYARVWHAPAPQAERRPAPVAAA
ncbi:CPBP family intramembrane glutamic endopeptidase [Nocardioides sp. URHA0020]|uniref:CPBP family intramembrane glutamic endopeptidase n=1 Tax=Nocardioides sp. URHA0020 TaxID=1380392 RepID=UPI0006856695|nr:CPBP family intramembrane glutamic endopeptidase [Nocardioides sp. URHA0020]